MRPSIRVAEPVLNGNERDYVIDCLDSTWISSRGKYIEQFEERFADFCGTRFAIATNNGTTALHLALAAHGIGPGDEVIVPTLTYIASVNAIRYCGATPVFVDVGGPNMVLDPEHVASRINDRTRGIVTVPLYGNPVEYGPLEELAAASGLFIVDDAAEALGATYRGKRVGAWGDCATFSFFGNKIITTGEGGMITTDSESLANKMRLLRGQGVSPDRCYWHNEVGFNYRMTNIAAAIGCGQLENISSHLERRQQVARAYQQQLESHMDLFVLPQVSNEMRHCYWMYTILLNESLPIGRDAVKELESQTLLARLEKRATG